MPEPTQIKEAKEVYYDDKVLGNFIEFYCDEFDVKRAKEIIVQTNE